MKKILFVLAIIFTLTLSACKVDSLKEVHVDSLTVDSVNVPTLTIDSTTADSVKDTSAALK